MEAGSVQRAYMKKAVASLIKEAGFQSVEPAALSTLVEVLQSNVTEMGRLTTAYAESARRVQPTVGDLTVAMTEMGLKIDPEGLRDYATRAGRPVIREPTPVFRKPANVIPPIFKVSKKRGAPVSKCVGPIKFPPLPEPHLYKRTPAAVMHVQTYQEYREKMSKQARDAQMYLSTFGGRSSLDSLFPKGICPLILPTPSSSSEALVVQDATFKEDMGENGLNFLKPAGSKFRRLTAQEFIYYYNHRRPEVDEGGDEESEVASNPYVRPARELDAAELEALANYVPKVIPQANYGPGELGPASKSWPDADEEEEQEGSPGSAELEPASKSCPDEDEDEEQEGSPGSAELEPASKSWPDEDESEELEGIPGSAEPEPEGSSDPEEGELESEETTVPEEWELPELPRSEELEEARGPEDWGLEPVLPAGELVLDDITLPEDWVLEQILPAAGLGLEQVTVPDDWNLEEILAGEGTELSEILTPGELAEILTPGELLLDDIMALEGMELEEISAPEEMEVEQISAPEERELEEITEPEELDVEEIPGPRELAIPSPEPQSD